jgi:hypothetical protein
MYCTLTRGIYLIGYFVWKYENPSYSYISYLVYYDRIFNSDMIRYKKTVIILYEFL